MRASGRAVGPYALWLLLPPGHPLQPGTKGQSCPAPSCPKANSRSPDATAPPRTTRLDAVEIPPRSYRDIVAIGWIQST